MSIKDEKRYSDEWSVANEVQSGILARKQTNKNAKGISLTIKQFNNKTI